MTVHPVALTHVRPATTNGAAAAKAAADKFKKYRTHFDLDRVDTDFVPFAAETLGTRNSEGQGLFEWFGHAGFPLTLVGDTVVDVDGRFGAFMTRAYARLSVAIFAGNTRRLEAWLQPTYSPDFPVMGADPAAAAALGDDAAAGNEDEGEVAGDAAERASRGWSVEAVGGDDAAVSGDEDYGADEDELEVDAEDEVEVTNEGMVEQRDDDLGIGAVD